MKNKKLFYRKNAFGAIRKSSGICLMLGLFSFPLFSQAQEQSPAKKDTAADHTKPQQDLGEVVVTSLGFSKRSSALTYSVQQVSAAQLNVARDANIMANLQGNVSGLQISPAGTGLGGSMRLVLRGNRSLLGNNQPLIVYNGIIIYNSAPQNTGFAGGVDLGSPMEDINSADVKEISVLKGGNSAALYGSLGYNGSLVLIGNSGEKKKGIGITFSTNTYVQIPSVLLKQQNLYGQGTYNQTSKKYTYDKSSATSWGAKFDSNTTSTPGIYWDAANQTDSLPYEPMGDGLSKFYQMGIVTINNLSIENAGDKYSIRASYGNTHNRYVIPGSQLNKNQISVAATYKFTDFIKTESFVSYTRQNTTNRNAGSEDQFNIMRYFITAPRSYSTDILSKHYLNENGNGMIDYGSTPNVNPYFIANSIINFDTRDRILASQQLEIKFFKDLKFKGIAGLDLLDIEAQSNYAINTYSRRRDGGVDINKYKNFSYNLVGLLEYNKRIKDFELNVSVGGMRFYTTNTSTAMRGEDLLVDYAPLVYSISNSAKTTLVGNATTNQLLLSAFGNLDLSYRDWAYLNATLRRDWTSTINQGYTYPSVSVAILPSQIVEALKFSVFDYWKIRFSYALLNTGGDPYQTSTRTYATPGPYLNDIAIARYGGSAGEAPEMTINNPNLTPEQTNYYEVGLDFSLLKKRVYLSATYFSMTSQNQIYPLNLAYSTGISQKIANEGEIRNSGVELELKTIPIQAKSFAWNLDVNFTYYDSKIASLSGGLDRIRVDGYYNAGFISAYNIIGLPYGQLYGSDYLRNPEGKIYYSQNGAPIANPNLQNLGSATPDFLIGIRNTFTYKGFRLSILLDWRQGGKVYSFTNQQMANAGTADYTTELRDEYNVGGLGYTDYKNGIVIDDKKENISNLAAGGTPTEKADVSDQVKTQGVEPSVYWGAYSNISKNFIYDASFMKIREISLVYTFDSQKLSAKTKGVIQGISIGYVGRNIATLFSSTPNIDPESSFTSGNAQGIEFNSLPIFATHGIKFTIDF